MQGYIANLSGAGTKTSTPLRETPQSVTVVTADRIKDQGATTVQESVRYVPGVYADAYGPDSRAEGLRIRGQEPNFYLDGMRMNSTATYNEWRPDPFTLERVEVLHGPSSMIYGDTSVAGLLNMVSKRPQAQSSNEIGVQFGSFQRKQVQIDSTGKLTKDGEWLYRFVGVFRDSDYQTDYVKDDRIVLAPSLTWRPTRNTTWTVLGTYQKDKTGSSTAFLPHEGSLFAGPNGFVPVNRFVGYPGWDKYQTESGAITSLFEHTFSETLTVRQNTRYVHADGIYRTAYPDSYANPANPFVDASRRSVYRYVFGSETTKDFFTSDSSAELKFATGPVTHKTLFGVDYRDFKQRGSSGYGYDTVPFDLYAPVYNPVTPPVQTPDAAIRQRLVGIYAQDQMRLGQWLLIAGVRHDTLTAEKLGSPDTTVEATTGRVGLMYELPFGLTPYVTYAQSFNPVFAGAACATLCAPQRGELVELGFKYNVSPDVVINGAVYDTTEKNRLAASTDGSPTYRQIGQVKIRGAELEVLARLTPDLDLIGAYSYIDALVQSGDNAGAHVETVPMKQASLWAKYRLTAIGLPGVSVGSGVRYIGDSWDGADKLRTPDYTLFDAMIRYETGPWRLQVNASNLADKRHVTTCLARGDCFYGIGRTVLGSATYKF